MERLQGLRDEGHRLSKMVRFSSCLLIASKLTFSCARSGNLLGYRLLRPCVTCSIARPAYTSYASVVSTDPNSARLGGSLQLSAGGVTGGGVVDGLLFHFRLDGVTPLVRLVGEVPSEELAVERKRRMARGPQIDEEEGAGETMRAGAPAIRRLRERSPKEGEKMLWKHIPSPQVRRTRVTTNFRSLTNECAA